jgi:hypothetical protein
LTTRCQRWSQPPPAGHSEPVSPCRVTQTAGACWPCSPPSCPPRVRVLELGTGVGTAWIVSGLLPRTDVTATTVENDPRTAAVAADGDWPAFVDLRLGNELEVLAKAGTFDLIFADAQGGKWEGLDRAIAALGSHGMLIVADMTFTRDWTTEQRANQDHARRHCSRARCWPRSNSAMDPESSSAPAAGNWQGDSGWAAGACLPVRRRRLGHPPLLGIAPARAGRVSGRRVAASRLR